MTRDRSSDGEATDGDRDDGRPGGQGRADGRSDGGRDVVSIPDEIELPRLLDFYELQRPADTGIAEFYARLRDGELSTTECADCGEVHFPPRIVCPECHGDDLAYVPLPECGELFAFSEVRAGAPLGMEEDVPFVLAIVDLGEVRLSARVNGARSEELAIGDAVELTVVEIDGPADHERVFFRFEPVEE